ncbi:MAG TPA: VWA domain-containing protein, partial [Pyrinomonadaceae bacterium]
MKKQSLVALVLLLSFLITLRGQTVAPAEALQSEDEVVRITANLVQVDAVVTDKDGRQVTDLRPEDFEILEDGRAQTVTNFSYVAADPGLSPPVASPAASPNKTGPPVRPARLRATDAHRTILLVVDDLGLTYESTTATRKALKKFVDEQMRPTDLVAVVLTSGGSSAWQQLTSDKRILNAAIERIRWYPLSRSGFDSFSSGAGSNSDMSRSGPSLPVANSSPASIPAPSTGAGVGPSVPVTDSIKALRFILTGLKGLPGRKSVVLFSDNFTIFAALKGNELEQYERLLHSGASADAKDSGGLAKAIEKQMEEMELKNISLSDTRQSAGDAQSLVRKLFDVANQASAVIYTVDPRGLLVYGLAADTTGRQALETGDSPGSLDNLMNTRSLK